MKPLNGQNYLLTPAGLRQAEDVAREATASNAETILSASGSPIAVNIAMRSVASLYRLRVGHREIFDAGDRLILTANGWTPLNMLNVMGMAVVRCGNTEPTPVIIAGGRVVPLNEKHALRIVEAVDLLDPALSGDRKQDAEFPYTVFDVRTADGTAEAYELGGIVVRTV